jgi:hypothetical protein
MIDSPADIVRKWLTDAAIADSDWPIYTARMPDKPDNALTVYDTAGLLEPRFHNTGERVEHYGCQIKVRHIDYGPGFTKARAIADALDALYNQSVTWNTTNYIIRVATRTSPVLTLGPEKDGTLREQFTVNATLTIAEAP